LSPIAFAKASSATASLISLTFLLFSFTINLPVALSFTIASVPNSAFINF
jgi:hypothetical protein